MKILICLSVFALSSAYATYVTYPYVYRTPLVQNGFYHGGSYGFSTLGAPSVTVLKPFYPGFYDYRLGLSPTFYQPGLYPGFAAAPTIIHLIPAEEGKDGKDGKKKNNKKKGKGKDGKEGKEDKDDDESTTMSSEDKEEVEKADEKEEDSAKSDSIEVESV
ncbi:UNVERIFIED_CONTAM: hypothetical protein PYX00_000857 [Menopon gallinae]|uniref:Uncharacterized protein n=1 Tax=Menopon gallinae TaxID=328185 RepID=A0AAW2IAP2_9NEOP